MGAQHRSAVSVVWHRGDLRTHDHPALAAAIADGAAAGLVILDHNILNATSARRRALFFSHVTALRTSYRARGGELFVRAGVPEAALPSFVAELNRRVMVSHIHALRSFTPYGMERDTAVQRTSTVPIHWHDGLYVQSPGTVRTKIGGAYSIYAPYRNSWRAASDVEPLESPGHIPSIAIDNVAAGDIPTEVCDVVLPEAGEDAALRQLAAFLERPVRSYDTDRDRLDGSGSSRLSIWITIGALSARTAVAAAWHRRGAGPARWVDEIAWRDFLADMLFHRPALLTEPFHPRWKTFEWNERESDFVAWRDGNTGVPAVDAAMRELRATGWISNRARMIAAQFLTKHLRIHWTRGARVFHEWLLDGDVASNTGNWQWSAGLGIDNAPYFRVFNPVTQAKQHDPDGAWLRRWVPASNGRADLLPDAIVNLADARNEYLAAAEESGR